MINPKVSIIDYGIGNLFSVLKACELSCLAIIVGIFFNALGAATLGLLAEIEWLLLPALFFGSLIGGYLGAKISLSKSNRTIKTIYQIITITIGVSLVL